MHTVARLYRKAHLTSDEARYFHKRVRLSYLSAGLSGPEGLAFDSAGNLYVVNGLGNSILKITPGGVASVFASGGYLGRPIPAQRVRHLPAEL